MRGINERTSKLNDLDLFCDYGEIDQNWVWTAKLSMTNNLLFSVGFDQILKIWNLDEYKIEHYYEFNSDEIVRS